MSNYHRMRCMCFWSAAMLALVAGAIGLDAARRVLRDERALEDLRTSTGAQVEAVRASAIGITVTTVIIDDGLINTAAIRRICEFPDALILLNNCNFRKGHDWKEVTGLARDNNIAFHCYLPRAQSSDIAVLEQFSEIDVLSVSGSTVNDSLLRNIARMSNVKTLIVTSEHASDRGIGALGSLAGLEQVVVDCPQMSDDALMVLCTNTTLHKIELVDADVSWQAQRDAWMLGKSISAMETSSR